MTGFNRVATLSICLLVVLALVADASANQPRDQPANRRGNQPVNLRGNQPGSQENVCDGNALLPCLHNIEGERPPAPSRQCCEVVQRLDKNCMCNEMKSSTFPAQYVKNGLQLPKKCGREDLRGFKCGRYEFPY